jgi:hypothetical protein
MSIQTPNSKSPTAGAERERHAFNTAFSELELCWHWDEKTFSELLNIASEEDRLRTYMQSQHGHLLKAYDADFLIGAIRDVKAKCFQYANESANEAASDPH